MNKETINPVKIHTPNSIKRFDSYIKPKEKVSIEKINIDNQINTEEINLDTTTSQNHSSSTLSDKSAIEINDLEKFTTTLYNAFNDDELYNYFIGIIKNRKIGDILDENDNLKPLRQIMTKSSKINSKSWTNEEYQQYLNESEMLKKLDNKIKDIRKNSNLVIYKGNDNNIKNLIIKDIVREDNGYDAVILQDQDGNYKICSSNLNDSNDFFTLLYSLLDNLTPGLAETITSIINTENQSGKKITQKQIESCCNLIEKYAKKAQDKGKKLELYGNSLGGGLTTTAYVLLKETNPTVTNSISSVTVYNPYLLNTETYFNKYISTSDRFHNYLNMLEGKANFDIKFLLNPLGNFTFFNRILGLNKRNLINELKNDNKFKIFAEDKNLVANFNSILSELDPVLLPSTITGDMTDSQGFKDLSKYSININDFVGNYLADNFIGDLLGFKKTDTSSKYLNPIKKNCTLLNELLKNAMQSKFSFSSLNDSCFDQNGNIIKYGQIKNINELISEIINIDYDGEKEELDYEYLENILFQSIIPITELASKFNYINKIPDGDYDVDIDKLSQFSRLDISRIINYCNENLGSKNFKLKDFTNILSEVIVDWIFNSQGKEFLTNHNVNPKFLDLLDEFQDQLKPLLVNALKASPTKLLNFLTFLTNGNDDLITPLLKELLIPGLASPEFIDENAQLINDIITSLGWGPSVAMFLTNGTQRIKDLLLACGNYSEIKDLATQIILEEHSKEDKDNLIRKIKEVNDGGIIDDVQWNILYFLINHFM